MDPKNIVLMGIAIFPTESIQPSPKYFSTLVISVYVLQPSHGLLLLCSCTCHLTRQLPTLLAIWPMSAARSLVDRTLLHVLLLITTQALVVHGVFLVPSAALFHILCTGDTQADCCVIMSCIQQCILIAIYGKLSFIEQTFICTMESVSGQISLSVICVLTAHSSNYSKHVVLLLNF